MSSEYIISSSDDVTMCTNKSRDFRQQGEPVNLSERTWSMKVNGDGSVTTRYGDRVNTTPALFDQSGRLNLRVSVDAHQPGHDFQSADNGTKVKLSCSCDRFTAIIEGGTENSRIAAARSAHDEHIARVKNGTSL